MTLLTPILAWMLALAGISDLPCSSDVAAHDGLPEMVTCGVTPEAPEDDEVPTFTWSRFIAPTQISNGF